MTGRDFIIGIPRKVKWYYFPFEILENGLRERRPA
jgi:hypothetical protein